MTNEISANLVTGWSDARVIVALIGIVGLMLSGVLALTTAKIVNEITKRSKEKELFQSVMQHMTGKTQNRSVGIALLNKYAEDTNNKDVVATIFLAQMLHLYDSGYGGGENIFLKSPETRELRKIEEFNYQVMKGAVESWGLPAISSKAKGVAHPLKVTPVR